MHSFERVFQASLAALGLVVFLGCSASDERPSISGKVTYNGAPVANQNLNLVLDAGSGDSFSQSVALGEDGKFAAELPQAGTFKVTIQESYAAMEGNAAKSKKGTVPAKYRSAKTTDISWAIKSGANSKDIELKD